MKKIYRSIKELVIDAYNSEGAMPSYEKLTALVREYFPNSKWQKTHYVWYKSQIKTGRLSIANVTKQSENTTSDIFISYKREEQAIARKLANALESEGWSVWWDPKLRAGEHFDDVIEKALDEAKCVIVMWSERSVKSRYVRDEATYALDHDKLVPVAIESVKLPFRFRGVHTLSLLGWAGSKDFAEFRRLVADIAAIVDPASKRQEAQTADIRKNWLEPEMVVIPPGTFQMGDVRGIGSSSEKPVHEVIIPKPFAIGSTEVTFKEYDLFADATHREKPELPAYQGRDRPPRPVINVSWNDAVEYAKWLSTRTGKRYRLPSEAEWEYAARSGGKEEIWSGTSLERELDGYAWYKPKSEGKTRQVGTKKPNALGLFDMSGNVWEWVEDGWHYDYKGAPTDGNAWVQGQSDEHVIRGGSWNYGPESLRTSGRSRVSTDIRRNDVGFRLAQDID